MLTLFSRKGPPYYNEHGAYLDLSAVRKIQKRRAFGSVHPSILSFNETSEALRTSRNAIPVYPRRRRVAFLKIGIVTRNEEAYSSSQLQESLQRHGIEHPCFSFSKLVARVGYKPLARVGGLDLEDLNALIIRPIGRGSLEELVFRMDVLYALQRAGLYCESSGSD